MSTAPGDEKLYRGRSFTGRQLQEIAFPLGGIGTGTVSLGGRGQLRDWEIFNRPGKGRDLPYTFFALWARAEGQPQVARVLERRIMPPYTGGFGLPTGKVSGLPRVAEARFTGFYPLARIEFEDAALPLQISLEAFNPFIPLNADDSGLPVAVFRWRLSNPGRLPVEATVAMSLLNAVGYGGTDSSGSQFQTGNRHAACFGQNRNELVREEGLRGLRMTSSKYELEDARAGSMAVVTDWPSITYLTHWERAGWWDDLQNFWDDFSEDGRLPDGPEPSSSPEGQTDVGSLGLQVTLAPGESASLPFVLAWHFPNLTNYWNGEESVRGKYLGNYYGKQFADAWAAASHTFWNLDRLERGTRDYLRTLGESTLPEPVLDAVSSQASIIRTTTCLRTADGRFHAFEGCGDQGGCCPLNCTHVWNYEQALAHLFPELERSMRLTDYGINTRPDGRMAFRTLAPLSPEALWSGPPAADGQMGCILKLYREWKLSGETEWLGILWPHARASLAYAWEKWDLDRDGVMEGEQHNTYDIEFYGPNTMMGTFYLAALLAAAEMAAARGDAEFQQECLRLYESGRKVYNEKLWNGEYYVQEVVPPAQPAEGLGVGTQSVQASGELRYQYGPGCLTDQLLGQWFARVVGLGHVLPPDRVKSSLASIFRYNFRRDLSEHANCQRIYGLNDEAGVLLCSWPNGGRPRYPFPYADEIWTGIEYQAAAHMIYEGLVEEGLQIVEAVRDRYDGEKRNLWNEVECGHHYARAMASWSLLLALSGFHYDAVKNRLEFAPKIQLEEFRCFFSTGSGWGLFRQEGQGENRSATIEVRWGEVMVGSLGIPIAPGTGVTAVLGESPLQPRLTDAGKIHFDAPVRIIPGAPLHTRYRGV